MANVEKEPGSKGTSPSPSVEPEKRKREYKDFAHDEDGPTSSYFFFPFFFVLVTDAHIRRGSRRHGHCSFFRFCSWSLHLHVVQQIELKAEDLYDKEKVDLETIVIDDVFKLLQCTEEGLSKEEALRRLELFGPNKLEVDEQNAFLQVSPFYNTLHFPN